MTVILDRHVVDWSGSVANWSGFTTGETECIGFVTEWLFFMTVTN